MQSVHAISPEPKHQSPENQHAIVQEKAVKKEFFQLIHRHAALRIEMTALCSDPQDYEPSEESTLHFDADFLESFR
jgi:hypothetical protein